MSIQWSKPANATLYFHECSNKRYHHHHVHRILHSFSLTHSYNGLELGNLEIHRYKFEWGEGFNQCMIGGPPCKPVCVISVLLLMSMENNNILQLIVLSHAMSVTFPNSLATFKLNFSSFTLCLFHHCPINLRRKWRLFCNRSIVLIVLFLFAIVL